MKFMAKTTMYAATWRDLSLATNQNVLVDNPLAGTTSGSVMSFASQDSKSVTVAKNVLTVAFFAFSCCVLLVSMLWFRRVRRQSKGSRRFPMKQPLVMT